VFLALPDRKKAHSYSTKQPSNIMLKACLLFKQCSQNDTPLLFVLDPYRYRHQCRQHCPQRTYEDRGRGLCISCIDPCVDCWNDALCLTCQSGYFLNSAYSTSSERPLSFSCLIAIAVSVTLLKSGL